MIKKLALLAAAAVLYVAAPAGPASAQGINVQIGGGGYHHQDRGYHRGPGYRHSRAYMRRDYGRRDYGHRHHGWDRGGSRTKTVIVR
ncbi:hypothetical protein SAMN03159423_2136 [Bradyrhizobium sp. NFR13]|jgi:hypothetical protein|uniref:hypothetical protein n=1 Tax=Bradyrhizobium sp. NFR13 TaxID=1566285 RepID=UPI0008ED8911|nr:hypothetical protein [Bradyrhizobium sp. NFR13]SFL51093.1 hypothetical protein SAMN03159423_2136 [Bradyrhizobium sp. NFR13]